MSPKVSSSVPFSGLLSQAFLGLSILTLSLPVVTGCSTSHHEARNKPQPVYSVARTQLPPPPRHQETRSSRPPLELPSATLPKPGPAINPVTRFVVRKESVEQATARLARMYGFSSFVSSTVAQSKISLSALGGLEEVAQAIASAAGGEAVVDRSSRHIQILVNSAEGTGSWREEPQFQDG